MRKRQKQTKATKTHEAYQINFSKKKFQYHKKSSKISDCDDGNAADDKVCTNEDDDDDDEK